jgi:glucose/arabinose dehydrogenase
MDGVMNKGPTRHALSLTLAVLLTGCGGSDSDEAGAVAPAPSTSAPSATPSSTPTTTPSPPATSTPVVPTSAVRQRTIASFDNPWAMVFLPDGRLLVTEKTGKLQLVTAAGGKTEISGVPAVTYSGQLGLQDVVLDPSYATNGRVWLSYAEPATGGQRLAVMRATLSLNGAPKLDGSTVIWRATPTTTGGQLGGRLVFSPDGRYLYVTSGERQQGVPAQDLGGTLGKIVRINLDGTAAAGNPFTSTAGAKAEIWSLGHRNPYGLVFASDGRLFESEMGPAGGDEFNLIEGGKNYGWPRVSEGDNYDGSPIARHATNSSYTAPLFSWNPVIAPGGMIQYHGTRFSGWAGDFVLAGLVQQGIVRVRVSGNTVTEAARLALGARIREVEEAPDGSIWVLQDGASAKLLELMPA